VIAVNRTLSLLASEGHTTSHLAVRELPASDLLAGVRDTPAVWEATDAVAHADGIVIATPVYKASYTGLLKVFLDLLPENALAGKVVLPLVTGGTIGHLLAIDYALRPVLTALGADHVVHGRFLLDVDIRRDGDGQGEGEGDGGGDGRLTPSAEARLAESVAQFTAALDRAESGLARLTDPAAVTVTARAAAAKSALTLVTATGV
jgi:FMN reductase